MKYPSINQFIKDHIRYKQHWNKRVISLTDAHWQSLEDDTFIHRWPFAKGSQFKVFESTNFGWLVFHPDTVLTNGSKPIKRIFKW
jgi:hypothetical protein